MAEDQEVIVEGETYDQVLAEALEILGAAKSQVEVTVINRHKPGFFGFRKQSITIRVVKKPDLQKMLDEVLDQSESPRPESRERLELTKNSVPNVGVSSGGVPIDGWIMVQNGIITVKDPEPGGRFPVIYPAEKTEIIVNGAAITEPTVVSSGDKIQIAMQISRPKQTIDILVSADKLTAYLKIQREAANNLILEDAQQTQVLKPRVTSVQMIWPEPPLLAEIETKIEQSGIRFGLDGTAVKSAMTDFENPESKVIIARGKPTVNASGGEITLKTNQASTMKNLNPYGEGLIHSVEAGAVLAEKNAPVYTEPGIDVYGVEIQPKKSRNVELVAREGAKVIKDGTVVVATITGRVMIEGKDKNIFSVLPIHTVYGDVDITVGNLKFFGDIIVLGNVLDGFRLEAGGDITIHGNVIHAELIAGRNITVGKNIISSMIRAGGDTLVYGLLEPLLKEISGKLEQLIATVEQLKKHPSFSVADLRDGDGRLIQLLIDSRYQVILKITTKLKEILAQNQTLKQSFHNVINSLNNRFYGLGPLRIKEVEELKVIKSEIAGLFPEITDLLTLPADIRATYVQNSSLRASGDINISGAGSIISDLTAGRNITIYNERGVVRGGQLSANGLIKLKEVGTASEAVVTITLIGKSKLEVDLIHPVVVLEYGNQKYRFETWPVRYVEAYANREGKLIVNSLKGKDPQ